MIIPCRIIGIDAGRFDCRLSRCIGEIIFLNIQRNIKVFKVSGNGGYHQVFYTERNSGMRLVKLPRRCSCPCCHG